MAAPGIPHWQAQILRGIGAPVTPANLTFVNAWARAEGGGAANNPFNTTQQAPGATPYNSVGVRNYVSPQQGIDATVQTLRNGRYGNILSALNQGTDPMAAAQALADSPWGTGALVEKELGGAPSAPGVTRAPQMPVQGGGINPSVLALLNRGNQMFGLAPLPPSFAAPSGGGGQQRGVSVPIGRVTLHGVSPGNPTDMAAVSLVRSFVGTPYVWGGASPKGFDCSGLLQYVWGKEGVQIPRTTYDQFKAGTPVPASQLRPGDAVFFTGSDPKNGLPGHVGMYIGAGKFIEAPHTGARVQISTLAGRSDFVGARRFA